MSAGWFCLDPISNFSLYLYGMATDGRRLGSY